MLNPEWRRRIDNWLKVMPSMFFRPLGNVAFKGFVTKEQLTAEQALKSKHPDACRDGVGRQMGIRLVQGRRAAAQGSCR
jgi:hypothetical protein